MSNEDLQTQIDELKSRVFALEGPTARLHQIELHPDDNAALVDVILHG